MTALGAKKGKQFLMERLLEGVEMAHAAAVVERELAPFKVQVDPYPFHPPADRERSPELTQSLVLPGSQLNSPHPFFGLEIQALLAFHRLLCCPYHPACTLAHSDLPIEAPCGEALPPYHTRARDEAFRLSAPETPSWAELDAGGFLHEDQAGVSRVAVQGDACRDWGAENNGEKTE